jgi:hypothetical protein
MKSRGDDMGAGVPEARSSGSGLVGGITWIGRRWLSHRGVHGWEVMQKWCEWAQKLIQLSSHLVDEGMSARRHLRHELVSVHISLG